MTIRKKRTVLWLILLLVAPGLAADLKGPYLGQRPPGAVPEVFAPGAISMPDSRETALALSPQGDGGYWFFSKNGDIYWRQAPVMEDKVLPGRDYSHGGSAARTGDWPQWRGPNRDGVSVETGLLKAWPAGGPPLAWEKAGLGEGYSSVAVVGDSIYATGTKDGNEICTGMDAAGSVKWQTDYGRAWKDKSTRSARCTPTVIGDRLYLITGYGDISCLDCAQGRVLWKGRGLDQFQGECHELQGVAESPLVVGDKVIFTAGGKQTSVVALDRTTGQTLWKSPSAGGTSCFISPIHLRLADRDVVVSGTSEALLGVSADTGEFAWTHRGVNWTVTPIYDDGRLYDGNNVFGIKASTEDVSVVWTQAAWASFGQFVRLGDRLYATVYEGQKWRGFACIDWQTGKTLYEDRTIREAAVTAADGLLYVYEHNGGRLLLVRPGEAGLEIAGSLRVAKGSGPHYAHPVISHGRLYVRHGDYLMTYDIRGSDSPGTLAKGPAADPSKNL
jgi:outer membrane protein assembly factor BamB